MPEKLGRVVRSQWEDLWVLLDREREEPHLELRLHNHGRTAETEGVSGGERIGLPVRLLPDLLQALLQAQDRLRAWGLLERSQSPPPLRARCAGWMPVSFRGCRWTRLRSAASWIPKTPTRPEP